MSAILRPYQIDVTAEFERHVERGDRSVLLVAPTGSGKTVIASAIIAGFDRRVLAIAHRRLRHHIVDTHLAGRSSPSPIHPRRAHPPPWRCVCAATASNEGWG